MNPTPSTQPPSQGSERPWFLRKEDGAEYGPVDLTRMQQWAQAGRVAPDDLVSRDRKTWTPAPASEELDLYWVLETKDGERYGPLHLDVCRALAQEEQIEAGTVLHNLRTRARVVLEQEPEDPSVRTSPAAPPRDVDEDLDVPPAWSIMARERDFSVDEARRWKTLYEAEHRSAVSAESAAQERIRALEQERMDAHRAREQAGIELAQLKKLFERSAPGAGHPDRPLVPVYHELSRRFEDLARRYEDMVTETSGLGREVERIRRESAEREERDRDRLRKEQTAADEARRKNADLEQSYAEAICSIRDLNDRFIRYRAEVGSRPEEANTGSPAPPAVPDAFEPPEKKPTPTPSAGPRIRLTR